MKYNQLILENNRGELVLTTKAKKRLAIVEIEHIFVSKPKKWDKNWRLIMYVIPENMKTQRDAFSGKLMQLGFKRMQDGVFAYPFACKTETEKICRFYGINKYVQYVEAIYVNNESKLLKSFSSLIK